MQQKQTDTETMMFEKLLLKCHLKKKNWINQEKITEFYFGSSDTFTELFFFSSVNVHFLLPIIWEFGSNLC